MSLGLLLILCVLYLPGGLASLRWATFKGWWTDCREWVRDLKRDLSGEKEREKQRALKRARENYFV
jgi:branched-chain amino acid transport system permease protein